MIKRLSGLLIIALFAISAFLPPQASNAQEAGRLYVAETGHWITNGFLAAYQNVHNPQDIYGYPITDAFINATTNRVIQYFQRALFELHPENPPELRVEKKLLGEFLYKKGSPLPNPVNSPSCQYFPETNHQVCYAFLDFFKANGGIAQFGYPISDIELHEGRMVQFFQRAAFEWHPELAPGARVILADLGIRYFNARHEDPKRLMPSSPADTTINTILSLKVRAFPQTAVMGPQGKQYIYVIVQDQNLLPVAHATVILTVNYPSSKEAQFVRQTDEYGVVNTQFNVNEPEAGIVEVVVRVSYDTLEQTTRSSFSIWW